MRNRDRAKAVESPPLFSVLDQAIASRREGEDLTHTVVRLLVHETVWRNGGSIKKSAETIGTYTVRMSRLVAKYLILVVALSAPLAAQPNVVQPCMGGQTWDDPCVIAPNQNFRFNLPTGVIDPNEWTAEEIRMHCWHSGSWFYVGSLKWPNYWATMPDGQIVPIYYQVFMAQKMIDLPEGDVVGFRLTAVNGFGESPPSNELWVVWPALCDVDPDFRECIAR